MSGWVVGLLGLALMNAALAGFNYANGRIGLALFNIFCTVFCLSVGLIRLLGCK